MEEPVSTPRLPGPAFKAGLTPASKEPLFSSSPGFGTPAYSIASRPVKQIGQPFAQPTGNAQAVLSIILPPQTLRPVAFRSLTKKHNLTLTSPGLALLAQFIGKFCGSAWREEGLGERVLDEIAKQWKKDNNGIIIDDAADKRLKTLLRSFEGCIFGGRLDVGKLSRSGNISGNLSRHNSDLRPGLSRDESQGSIGLSALEVEDKLDIDEDALSQQDARAYLKVISAFNQPRLMYSIAKKSLEPLSGSSTLTPPIHRKMAMFRNRYHLVHQRLLRNESFQTPSFTTTFAPPKLLHAGSYVTAQQAYKITPVSNLLGRSGSSHLLLGLLVHTAAGDLALTDLSSSVVLDMSLARSVPEDGVWFCPGMFALVEGGYEEDGSNNLNFGSAGGVGGQIKGRFLVDTMAGPPAERREITLGLTQDLKVEKTNVAGAGFGWVDFLGMGSEKAVGPMMRRIKKRLLTESEDGEDDAKRTKVIVLGECHLDSPKTLEAIRAVLSSYLSTQDISDLPVAVVLMGNFVSAASMAGSAQGGGSIEYKEQFDNLASVLSEFPSLIGSTTLIFVPGDNDPWASSFAAGAATLLPKQSIPDLFTSRIRRAVNTANTELGRKEGEALGETIWTSNPARISLFGPVDELVLFRDDITSRMRRNAVLFPPHQDEDDKSIPQQDATAGTDRRAQNSDLDEAVHIATSHQPQTTGTIDASPSTITARRLVKTVLDQGHLSPFVTAVRPVLWDFASSLNLYPLPTAMILADAEAPAFAITYEGCHVMNPGRLLDDMGLRKGVAKWMEFDIRTKRGTVKDVRF